MLASPAASSASDHKGARDPQLDQATVSNAAATAVNTWHRVGLLFYLRIRLSLCLCLTDRTRREFQSYRGHEVYPQSVVAVDQPAAAPHTDA